MYLKDIIRSAKALYNSGSSVHLIGPPGIGKSAIIEHDIQAMMQDEYDGDFAVVTFYLTSIEAPDVGGFCIPTKDKEGHPTAMFTKSAIYEAVLATGCSRGILFLDERGQADHIIQKAIAPAVHSGIIGRNKLPEGWRVWSASNRVSDRSGVNRPLAHLTNREVVLDVEAELAGAVKYFERKRMHHLGIAFLKARPGIVITNCVPDDPGPYCTLRSFERALNYLQVQVGINSPTLPDDSISLEIVQGNVGKGTALEMMSFFKVANRIATIEEILDDPEKAKLPAGDQMDAQYASIQLCLHHLDASNVDTLFTYIKRLNKEFQTSAVVSMIDKLGSVAGSNLMASKSMAAFMKENKELLLASINA